MNQFGEKNCYQVGQNLVCSCNESQETNIFLLYLKVTIISID